MITLPLNSQIYTLDNIEIAKAAYVDITNVDILKRNNYWVLQFTSCKYDENATVKAFENYLIGLENS